MEKKIENNIAILSGTLISEFGFDHEIYGESFYIALLQSERLSGEVDIIPTTVSERLIDARKSWIGRKVRVSGQFRSYIENMGNTNHLKLCLFAREIETYGDDERGRRDDENLISVDGYFCKISPYRVTPLGREITDALVAVNRPYGKSDYIPCVFWGRNARLVDSLPIGTHYKIFGRMQSRKYKKRVPDKTEIRIAYEVSVATMEEIQDDKQGTD